MFDFLSSLKPKSLTPEKLLSVSAATLLVAIGLCSGGAMLASHNNSSISSAVPGVFAFAGTICLFGSLLGLVAGIVWGVLRSIFSGREQ
jgi:hypothetical protein